MPAAAKPSVLTRKAGPLPVWAWALAGLVLVWFVFLRPSSAHSASSSAAAPDGSSTTAVPSSKPGPDTGSGGALDDLLAQLFAQQSELEQSLAQGIQQGGGLGGGSSSSSSGAAGGASSGATAAPVDLSPAATDPGAQTVAAGTNTGTVDVNGTAYTGYTTTPSAVTAAGTPTTGIIPGETFSLGGGAPVLDSMFAPQINTPAYAVSDVGVQNAGVYAARTATPVAAP